MHNHKNYFIASILKYNCLNKYKKPPLGNYIKNNLKTPIFSISPHKPLHLILHKRLLQNKRYYHSTTNQRKQFSSYWSRIMTGFKHAWNIPSLPYKISYFHNHILTRIFRIIGGLSIVTFLSGVLQQIKPYLFSNNILWPIYYLVLFLALSHFLYIISIKSIKIVHMIKVWREGKLDVRNSPLDKFATSASKLLYCWKFGCEVGSAGLGLVGSGFLIDQVLEAGNQNKVFTPLIGKGVHFLVKGQSEDGQILLNEIKKQTEGLENFKKQYKAIKETLNEAEEALENNNNFFTKDDFKEIKKGLKEVRDADEKKLSEMAKELAKNIKKYSEK